MSDRLPSDPPLTNVNVLRYLSETDGLWDEVRIANDQLNQPAESDQERLMQEAVIIESFENRFFGMNWFARDAMLSVAYPSAATKNEPSQLGVETTKAQFMGCTDFEEVKDRLIDAESVTFVKDVGQKVVAFCFMTDKNEMFTIPIDKNYLLGLEVEIERSMWGEKTMLDKLKNRNRVIRHYLHSEWFLTQDLDVQTVAIDTAIQDIEKMLPIAKYKNCPHMLVVDDGSEAGRSVRGDHLSLTFLGHDERKKPYRKAKHFEIGEFCLRSTSAEDGESETFPVSSVIDIIDLSPASLDDDMLLNIFDDPKQAAFIANAEEYINGITDENLLAGERGDMIEQLNQRMPKGFFNLSFSVTGRVYHHHESAEGELEFIEEKNADYHHGSVTSFDIRNIDGKWRVVLPIEVETGETVETDDGPEQGTDLVYVIPNRTYTDTLNAHEDDENLTGDHDPRVKEILDKLKDCVQTVETVIQMDEFRNATRKKQIKIVDTEIKPFYDYLQSVLQPGSDARFCCAVSRYREIPANTRNDSCAQLAKLRVTKAQEGQESLTIEGDKAYIAVPELWDDTITSFYSDASFPLSGGRPILLIDNREENTTYCVELSDIANIASYVHSSLDQ